MTDVTQDQLKRLSTKQMEAWRASSEWLLESGDVIFAAAYVAERENRYAFIVLDWANSTPDKVEMIGVSCADVADLERTVKLVLEHFSPKQDVRMEALFSNTVLAKASDNTASLLIPLTNDLLRSTLIQHKSLTKRQIFEMAPSEHLGAIKAWRKPKD